ncbi:enoyl-CoA hydratase domain-containing protein 3, mitochondrial [Arctopsyche grandis]|uniref:enoyl-CoA hydratase domain-containing protein 3, mitochondrial n=1 Tax=Arctopsyche grandis TaxID=121162 RepID=UPI00406D91EC
MLKNNSINCLNLISKLFRNSQKPFAIIKCSNSTTIDPNNDYLINTEQNGIRNIILNHTKTRNSLSLDMMSTLVEAITNNKDDPKLRSIVLSANGQVFSAGHNLKELTDEKGIDYHKTVFRKSTELMTSIISSPVPVIAKINGLAAAAGCQLIATCDIIVCSEHSSFSTPGANFGIFCSTPGIAIGRSVPKATAMHMLLTGFPLTAKEAYTSGLVTKVVPEDQLDLEVATICEAISAKSRSVVSLGKQFYYKQISQGIYDAYKLGEEIMVMNINLPDGQEGINSFAQKRKPKWS